MQEDPVLERDRAIGALVGLAVGDAVGTTLEFSSRDSRPPLTDMIGGGPFRLRPGQWTDDTSMALCLVDSLLACGGLDECDLMGRFVRWWHDGENACTGECFDIGNTVRAALMRFEGSGDPVSGSTDPRSAGNGSLMRLAPVAIYFANDPSAADRAARAQSATTHGAQAALDACAYFATLLVEAIGGASKEHVLRPQRLDLCPEIASIAAGSWKSKPRDQIESTGYVAHTLEAALWAVGQADDFESAVLTAANLGGDADTVAAVTGQLAGALWGLGGIPEHWRARLAWREHIERVAEKLFDHVTGQPRAAGWTPPPSNANRSLLERLLREDRIAIRGMASVKALPRFEIPPVAKDRWRGMLLGLAIGDALGNTSESQLPRTRYARYGEIRDYLPNRHAGGLPVGLPSDDTQLAFWTVEQLLEDGRIDPNRLAERFASRRIFGVGSSVKAFIRNFKRGLEWPQASSRSAGNGALMRIAPVVLPHIGRDSESLWVDAVLCGAVTHNDSASISACVAFSGMLAQLLSMPRPPDPQWWLETYLSLARTVETDALYRPRGGAYLDKFEGSLSSFVAQRIPKAWEAGLDVRTAGNAWYSGAFLLETVPSVLYVLMRHGDDPEEAIVRAVNDTKDNDTIGAIVGAAVGALHGENALPLLWRHGLLGRTAERDDGHIFALLKRLEQRLPDRA